MMDDVKQDMKFSRSFTHGQDMSAARAAMTSNNDSIDIDPDDADNKLDPDDDEEEEEEEDEEEEEEEEKEDDATRDELYRVCPCTGYSKAHYMVFLPMSQLDKLRRLNDPKVECADCHEPGQAIGGAARCIRQSASGHLCTYSLCPECYFKRNNLLRANKEANKPENQENAPRCTSGHKLFDMHLRELQFYSAYPTSATGLTFICDACFKMPPAPLNKKHAFKKKEKKVQRSYDTHAFHCPLCRYDLCPGCYEICRDLKKKEKVPSPGRFVMLKQKEDNKLYVVLSYDESTGMATLQVHDTSTGQSSNERVTINLDVCPHDLL